MDTSPCHTRLSYRPICERRCLQTVPSVGQEQRNTPARVPQEGTPSSRAPASTPPQQDDQARPRPALPWRPSHGGGTRQAGSSRGQAPAPSAGSEPARCRVPCAGGRVPAWSRAARACLEPSGAAQARSTYAWREEGFFKQQRRGSFGRVRAAMAHRSFKRGEEAPPNLAGAVAEAAGRGGRRREPVPSALPCALPAAARAPRPAPAPLAAAPQAAGHPALPLSPPLPSTPRLPPRLHTGRAGSPSPHPGGSERILCLDFEVFVTVQMTHPTSAGFPGK